ncbi:MAG TPA: RdgB/HAM1 family non-canonical purine NTP pyrophosphatase [Candidatus Ozemobacteraceae bacterium]|nr:RdgB/HAM1 family non-canonical purine NTP pyrophosphatase [Candidatus Ozemobacteraceae bacterium]
MKTLWVASRNRHKLQEIAAILGPNVTLKSLLDRPDIPDVDENASTYLENARLKAQAIWAAVREPVVADDSGLEVDALGGRPGVHSARYSAPNPSAAKNITKLLGELGDLPAEKRSARFRCTVVYFDESGREHTFAGTLEGRIGTAPCGAGGFGFDPVFWLDDRGCMVAELSDDEKNRISHRGRAFAQLKTFLQVP